MNNLLGIWMYASLIYNGTPLQRPDERLKMYFAFENSRINEIVYSRDGESGHCRRKAEYEIRENTLIQTVTDVDEDNADFCSQDTDMRLGNYSETKFEIKNGKFLLNLPLGDETLTYVWERQTQREEP